MTLIDEILGLIGRNNGHSDSEVYSAILSGRREAYEHVLRLIGYYDDEDEVRTR